MNATDRAFHQAECLASITAMSAPRDAYVAARVAELRDAIARARRIERTRMMLGAALIVGAIVVALIR